MYADQFLKDTFMPISLGLDIGNFSVKIAQIKKIIFSQDKFLSFTVAPIEDNKSPEAIIAAIKQAHRDLATESKKVNISISGPNVIIRYIILPRMRKADLSRSLEFELEKYVPHKREDVVVDYRILARLPSNQMLVLLVAVKHQFIQERIDLVKDAGLEPLMMNVDTLALAEAFKIVPHDSRKVVALLDVGYQFSKLLVMDDNIPCFSRDIETGEYDLLQMISRRMGIDFTLAKEYGYNPAPDKTAEIMETIKVDFNTFLDELSLSFEYCERNLDKKVTHLYLTGGGTKLKILVESFKKIPNLTVDFLEVTQRFKISPDLSSEKLKEYAHLLALAIGLAL